ncbi:putative ABC transporter ATP-binding protein [Candidatus Lokiarchaeum ossiferum]|uniref:ABC transporter ATP-binding protein n=1 Tax=Candidatus Lokiarchaeum ossiferum TaxID=2951803 RepID=A0ABY6HX17_9ARCH|nr:putative ABC transporter ATP-binding protein [Candidatus Lokiarchaeum sp. B-35]
MPEVMIKLENVQKEFRLRGNIIRALADVNIEINAGEFVIIMGPTGCGKTTMLNVMSGLDLPDDGSIVLDGEKIDRASEERLSNIRRRKIGFVFQDFNLIENLTAIENIEAVLWPGVLRSKEIEDRAINALRKVDLLDRKDNLPKELSGGEKQRTAIARAIIHKPRVLFADEPTGNLDAAAAQQIMELLKSLNKEMGTTMCIVTHDKGLVKYGTRLVEMEHGRVVKS